MNVKWLFISIIMVLVGCSSTVEPFYVCNNGTQFTVLTIDENTAEIVMAHKRIALKQIPAASGSKYQNTERELLLWLKGTRAMLTLSSDTVVNCDQVMN
ncbi:MliC family protein [Vibrio sp. F74]|uniref:MliC family protein n=1 Tax=Vibrio sp. F74 TaxID=700020 RepID=UPI0035F56ECB